MQWAALAALRRGSIRLERFKTDLTAGDRRSQAAQWAGQTWVRCGKLWLIRYMGVKDILAIRFNSMDQYMQHGNTTCKTHQVSYLGYQFAGDTAGWRALPRQVSSRFVLYDWHTHARETGEHFHGFNPSPQERWRECVPAFFN